MIWTVFIDYCKYVLLITVLYSINTANEERKSRTVQKQKVRTSTGPHQIQTSQYLTERVDYDTAA